MTFAGRLLLLAGAAGLALSVLLPWVTIRGLALALDLDIVGAEVTPGSKTVAGLETSIWPAAIGIAAAVFLLTVLNVARKLMAVLGLVVVAAGGALIYYTSNVIDIETSDSGPLARALADAVVDSSMGPGPPLIAASGLAIMVGALLA